MASSELPSSANNKFAFEFTQGTFRSVHFPTEHLYHPLLDYPYVIARLPIPAFVYLYTGNGQGGE